MGVFVSSINQLESKYSDKPDEFFYSLKEDLKEKFEKIMIFTPSSPRHLQQ